MPSATKSIIGTARILCRAGPICNCQASVRLSVPEKANSSKLAAVGPAYRRYRSSAAAAAGECGQCHFVSVRKKLNTDLFVINGVTHTNRRTSQMDGWSKV